MSNVIGVDLGTTSSSVAVMQGGAPHVITDEEGAASVPSIVTLTADDQYLVGKAARRHALTAPDRTIFSGPRLLARRGIEVDGRSLLPYDLVDGSDGSCCIRMGHHQVAPTVICAQVLDRLKRTAARYLGEDVSEAVIAVPAGFDRGQRRAVREAARLAGLVPRRLVRAPVAVALAETIDHKEDSKVAVVDIGGGHLGVALMEAGENVLDVLAATGDEHLGGDGMDSRLMEWLLNECRQETQLDISFDRVVRQRLRKVVEKARIELSSVTETEIDLPFLAVGRAGPVHFNREISRVQMEHLLADLIARMMNRIRECLDAAKLRPRDIDTLLLAGGVSRMPAVRSALQQLFQQDPAPLSSREPAASGAALTAGIMMGAVKDVLVLETTPHALGIEVQGGLEWMIARHTTIPTRKREVFSTVEDGQTSVEVRVFEGEHEAPEQNRMIARVELEGMNPAPRGVPLIEVTLDVDLNDLVGILVKDKVTGREVNVLAQSYAREAVTGRAPANIGALPEDPSSPKATDAEPHLQDW